MARYLLAYLVCLALTLSTPSRADTVSCIFFSNHLVPHGTYKTYLDVQDNGACCRLCADDDNCVAWTRDHDNRCSLKNNAQFLVKVGGVDSGVKYRGDGNPTLKDNAVGASVLFVKAEATKTKPAAPSRGSVARASVRVTTVGGRGSASVTSNSNGVTSRSSAQGRTTVVTSGSSPTVSLATFLSSEEGKEKAKVAIIYYPSPVVVGHVVIIGGTQIPIISSGDGTVHCYKCAESPCIYSKGLSFKGKGTIIKDFTTGSRDGCCRACKNNPRCVTWWYSLRNRCVLNSDLPERSPVETHVGGLYL